MTLLRCFLAVELPPSLQDAIHSAIVGPRRSLGPDLIRWVPGRNVHLTLKFLGDKGLRHTNIVELMYRLKEEF